MDNLKSQKIIEKINKEEKLQEEKLEEAYMQQQYEDEIQRQAELDKLRIENYDFEYGDYKY